MINKHKSNEIKENSNTVRHLHNGTDHRHSKSCCDQSSPARRTIKDVQSWFDVLSGSSNWIYITQCEGKAHSVPFYMYILPAAYILISLRQVSDLQCCLLNHWYLIYNHQIKCAANALDYARFTVLDNTVKCQIKLSYRILEYSHTNMFM